MWLYAPSPAPVFRCRQEEMSGSLQYLAPIAVGAVALVLLLGLVNMMRGGPGNRSQLLMRWRVILQFIAIVVMMAALYFGTR
jgi:hypothetical protein